jgi:two-component system response regulator MtrA
MMSDVSTGLNLLLVEDDSSVAAMYALVLMEAGHEVRVSFDGRSALQSARRRAPDLVLLDVRLPDLDGFTVVERLRELDDMATVPVVMLSNFRTPEMTERGVELGVMAYLLKTDITPAQLRARIDAWRASQIVGGSPPPPVESLDRA